MHSNESGSQKQKSVQKRTKQKYVNGNEKRFFFFLKLQKSHFNFNSDPLTRKGGPRKENARYLNNYAALFTLLQVILGN